MNFLWKIIGFLLLLLVSEVKAQKKVGQYIDPMGGPIDGYLDDFDYWGGSDAYVVFESDINYLKGYYYTTSGEKIEGQLKCYNGKTLFYKEMNGYAVQTLELSNVESVMIGCDSLVVIHDAHNFLKNKTEKKSYVAKILGETDAKVYAQCFSVRADRNKGAHYFIYNKENGNWVTHSGLDNKYESFSNMYYAKAMKCESSMIDLPHWQLFLEKAEAGSQFYFDKYWNYQIDSVDAVYQANFELVDDSLFHVTYYQNNVLVHESTYYDIFPFKRLGKSIWYYPNGVIRKETEYEEGEAMVVKTFFESGKKHYEYLNISDSISQLIKENSVSTHPSERNFSENKISFDSLAVLKKLPPILYSYVGSAKGGDVLASGNGVEELYDSINKVMLFREYENYQLQSSYFVEGVDTIYQHIGDKSRRENFASSLLSSIDLELKRGALSEKLHGIALIKLRIDPKGKVVDYNVVKGVNNSLTEYLEARLDEKFSEFRQLKKYKVNGKPVNYEIIVPLSFGFAYHEDDQSIMPYYYFHDPFMFQMNQQHMMNQMIKSIPKPPGF